MMLPDLAGLNADVLLERSTGPLGKAIRWFTGSQVNHVGLVFEMSKAKADLLSQYGVRKPERWIGRACVIEALWRVKVAPLDKRLLSKSQVALARCNRMDKGQRKAIVRAALGFAGQKYGVRRLFAFGASLAVAKWPVLGRWRPMRRMALDEVICSYLVAFCYAPHDEQFGPDPDHLKLPRECSPEDIQATTKWDDGWATYFSELDMPEV